MSLKVTVAALLLMQNSPLIVVGPGNDSCGQWTAARRAADGSDVAYRSWITGYLTAVNVGGERDVLRGRRVSDAMLWVDAYCRSHPMDSIQRATGALTAYLITH